METILLWTGGVPGRLNLEINEARDEGGFVVDVHEPTLTVLRPQKPNGIAVLICPGGGYIRLSFETEGLEAARFLNRHGIVAFVLKYRLVEYGQPAPLLDAQRALRLIRSRATEFGIDPGMVGVLGFSAGGHLAACASTMYPDSFLRPAFAILVYPAITMTGPFAQPLTRRSLLGASPSAATAEHWSPHLHVTPATPPTLVVAALDDASVSAQNSVLYSEALTAAGVRSQLLLHPSGGHGFGVKTGLGPISDWPQAAIAFIGALRSTG